MSKTYHWTLTEGGSWTTAGKWLLDPPETTGTLPGYGDYARIGELAAQITVTLSTTEYIRSLALGGTGALHPKLNIAGGHLYLANGPAGTITDSWSYAGGSFSGGGTIGLYNSGSLFVQGTVASGIGLTFDGTRDILYLGGTSYSHPDPGVFAGSITGFGGASEIVLNRVAFNHADTLSYSDGVLTVRYTPTGTDLLDLRINEPVGGFHLAQYASANHELDGKLAIIVCFAAGTRILTERGEVAVECLAEGDQVVTLDGGERRACPVRWLGRRRLNLSAHPNPESAAPVRIRAGAFAEAVPSRDLLVSPDHAILGDGKLIPAKLLVNGGSIVQELGHTEIEYFHVQLDRHAILFAEGLTAESYLDTGNRAFFANAGVAMMLHPEFTVNAALKCWESDSCAPLVVDEAAVEPIWRRLADRGIGKGYSLPRIETACSADLMLEANGHRFRPVHVIDGRHIFALPRAVIAVRLISRAASPSALRPWLDDRRQLGVMVDRVVVDGQTVAMDDARLADGWWHLEAQGRWTNGDALLLLPELATLLEVRVAATLPAYPVETTTRVAA